MSAEIDQPDLLQNELPKQYQVLGQIKAGGMGAIYKVENRFTKVIYAVKVINPENAKDASMRQRFIVEAKAASLLKHPNICQTYDFGVSENHVLYLVMEWLSGISLQQKVSRDGPLPAAEVTAIFQQVASALTHAHENSVIHRDLKPDNIMLSRDQKGGTVVHIVDFGIAKVISDNTPSKDGLTQAGALLGTPMYMSPEQANGDPVDQRADLYSLGCVMYFALSGKPPFLGNSLLDTLYQHVHKPPPPLDASLKISNDMISIMMKALEKKPEDRYQNMNQLLADLNKMAKGHNVKPRLLARDRKKIRSGLLLPILFIAGFMAIQLLFSGIEALNNSMKQQNAMQKTTAKTAGKLKGKNVKPVVPNK
ncbi:MAG: serine/threonine-protein kinase [Candidatus Obscuribacterales bacterium]